MSSTPQSDSSWCAVEVPVFAASRTPSEDAGADILVCCPPTPPRRPPGCHVVRCMKVLSALGVQTGSPPNSQIATVRDRRGEGSVCLGQVGGGCLRDGTVPVPDYLQVDACWPVDARIRCRRYSQRLSFSSSILRCRWGPAHAKGVHSHAERHQLLPRSLGLGSPKA